MAVKSLSWMDGDGQMVGLHKRTKALRSNGHMDHTRITAVNVNEEQMPRWISKYTAPLW